MADKDKRGNGSPKAAAKDEAAAPTEGSTEATAAPATEEKAPKEDPVPALREAVTAALSGATPEGTLQAEHIEALQAAYRKVPAAKRGPVQAEILRSHMADSSTNHQALAAVLGEMTNSAATKTRSGGTRVAKPAVPVEQTVGQAIAVLRVAEQTLLADLENDELRSTATKLADEALASTLEGEARDTFLGRVSRVVRSANPKVARSGGGGNGGERTLMKESLADLISRGDLAEGTVLKNGDTEARIVGGKISVLGKEFENPSGAASAVIKSRGKDTAVNGWAFWNVEKDGKSVQLGSLRRG